MFRDRTIYFYFVCGIMYLVKNVEEIILEQKVIYYTDNETDEFAGVKRKTITIDDTYKYIRKNPFWHIASFIVYRLIMAPFVFFYNKIKFGHKIVNKKVLKKADGKGYFLYGNHTLFGGDAFIPNMITFPKKLYTVVHADNLSLKGTKWFIELNNAFPLPTSTKGMRNFINAMEKRVVQGNAIQIYPEAHVWPYYTKIRNFKKGSFRYPVKFEEATFCFTNTFHKRKFTKKPKVITYVDGPFYPDKTLSSKMQEEQLEKMVYDTMVERSKLSTYEYVIYKNKGEITND